MPVVGTMEVAGDLQFVESLQALDRSADSMREPLYEAAGVLQDLAWRQFQSEGGYAGTPWAPLSPDYARRKLARWGPQPILVASGDLRSQLTTDESIQELSDTTLTWGSRDRLAEWHQRGTRRMPARPIVVVTEREQRLVDRAFSDWLDRRTFWAGFRRVRRPG